MSATEERKSEAAEDMASELEYRQEERREAERAQLKDLNQGMGTGGHDASHRGVKWGPSYRTRRKKAAKPKQEEEEKQ